MLVQCIASWAEAEAND